MKRVLAAVMLLAVQPVLPAEAGDRTVSIRGGVIEIRYRLDAGTADVYWHGKRRLTGLHSTAGALTTKGRSCSHRHRTVTCVAAGQPTIKQRFEFDRHHFSVRVELSSGTPISVDAISAVKADRVDLGIAGGDKRMLFVPIDNDHWVRYESKPSDQVTPAHRSFEVTSFFDDISRRGFVFGSVEHDTWKSGITAAGSGGRLDQLSVTAGLTDFGYDYGTADNRFQFQREKLPHRAVSGTTVSSPRVLVGYFDDWRSGMETFGRVTARAVPTRTWDKGTPFGMNTWGGLGGRIADVNLVKQTSDFIAGSLPQWRNGTDKPYVGLDSYWDALLEPQWDFTSPSTSWRKLSEYVAHVRANGQEPALYFQPFANFWQEGLDQQIGGTSPCDGCPNQTLRQMSLKANGNPISLDGAWALDPTNPGVLKRAGLALTKFRELGVRYVKMDFFYHAMVESDSWYDASVQTGMQAFHKGMRQIVDLAGPDTFIDLAISPLFMGQYGHARRISCDTHGAMNNWHESQPARFQKSTEYLLNSLTYGWWLDELYVYNDADHIQFGNYYYDGADAKPFPPGDPAKPRIWPENYNRARVTSAVITGVYLISDDFSASGDPVLKERAVKFLRNPEINAVAALGRSFRPVDGNTGFKANNLYVLRDGWTTYLAVFNFDTSARTFTLDPARIGLDKRNRFRELWSGKTFTTRGTTAVTIPAEDAAIYRIN